MKRKYHEHFEFENVKWGKRVILWVVYSWPLDDPDYYSNGIVLVAFQKYIELLCDLQIGHSYNIYIEIQKRQLKWYVNVCRFAVNYLVFLKRFLLVPRILLPSKFFLSGPVTNVASTPLPVFSDWKSTTSSSANERNPVIFSTL